MSDIAIDEYQNRVGIIFNEPQRKLIKSMFKDDIMSNSAPGTGKSTTIVHGLIYNAYMKDVDLTRVICTSYNVASRYELENKFLSIKNKFHVDLKSPVFMTIDALCKKILVDNAHLLPSGCNIRENNPIRSVRTIRNGVEYIEEVLEKKYDYLVEDISQAKNIYTAIEALNDKFKFGVSSVENSVEFKKCKIDFNRFTNVRKELLDFHSRMSKLSFTEIQLTTLQLLVDNPSVCEEYKNKYDLIIVDEYQDLSILSLQIFNLLANKLICIGDIRQQIYEYKGANPFVCSLMYELRDNIIEIPLSYSYRCPKSIRDYSLNILQYSKFCNQNDFIPSNEEGEVIVSNKQNMIIKSLVYEMKNSPESYMFLFRNNLSSVPILDSLYRNDILAYAPKFKPGFELPILSEICRLIELIKNPNSVQYVGVLKYFIPEWNHTPEKDIPIIPLQQKSKLPFWDITMNYENPHIIYEFFNDCKKVKKMLHNKEKFIYIFEILYRWYVNNYLEVNNNKLFCNFDHELAVVAITFTVKPSHTYDEFIAFECDKERFFKKATPQHTKVQVYTFFSSKGLEADNVILLDSKRNIIPSKRRVDRLIKDGNRLDAYTSVNNETNVLFVASTRAKKKLYVLTEGEEFSELLPDSNNSYKDLMLEFKNVEVYDNISAYKDFLGR